MRRGNLNIRGNMQISHSETSGTGGAVRVEGSVVQHAGVVTFMSCPQLVGNKQKLGGALSVTLASLYALCARCSLTAHAFNAVTSGTAVPDGLVELSTC